ncbi:CcdB family protein [Geothrix fuzhouensis]|uniref:CcdB family protein n=1 Tax=Geothrix fuzhouensis TaxID=2966451 RepID=UPI0021475372|nr:CcdB family protein [Geothrix fuzhouensis]
MVSYSVFRNPNPGTNTAIPFLLDVQSEVLSMLGTRLVVPLYRTDAANVHTMSRLTPVVDFQGQPLVAIVPELAGIPRRELGAIAGDLLSSRGEILAAMDLLLTGF